jgi:hypothetical protein
MRSCLGVVLAGLVTRAGVGVGGLDGAINSLEEAHAGGYTSYCFALREGRITAQGSRRTSPGGGQAEESAGWDALLELGP